MRTLVAQRQMLGIGLHVTVDRRLLTVGRVLTFMGCRLVEHLERDVAADDFESFTRHRAGEPARAARQVEDGPHAGGAAQCPW
jgi:hypothetical protein